MTMEGDDGPDPGDATLDRRRRLLAMGSVPADEASDETDQGWGDGGDPRAADLAVEARLRREVPPHHGG
ncbi:MAG: hypothetical protein H0V13_11165 [Nocardioidaceae bacterium]|nr:hypothetical protein [Nocardioidaceae bacterium]